MVPTRVAQALVAVPLALTLAIAMSGCNFGAKPGSRNTEHVLIVDPDSPLGLPAMLGLPPKAQPETRVLTPTEATAIDSVAILNPDACVAGDPDREPCQYRLTFATLPTGIVVGSVLVSAITVQTPDGLLVRATSVAGSTVLATEATLGDALVQGEFELEQPFTHADVTNEVLAPGVRVIDATTASATTIGPNGGGAHGAAALGVVPTDSVELLGFNYGIEHKEVVSGVFVDGHIGLNLSCGAYGGLTWKKVWGVPVYPNGASFLAKCGVSQSGSIKISSSTGATVAENIEITSFDLAPITFFVGPVPVVLFPHLTITAGVNGQVGVDMSVGASEHFTAEAGIDCTKACKKIATSESGSDSESSIGSGRLSLTGSVVFAQSLLLYHLVGPELQETLYLSLEGKPAGEKPTWCLFGGVKGGASLVLDLGIKTFRWGPEVLFDKRVDLSCAANQAPVLPAMLDISAYPGSTYDTTLKLAATDPEDGPLPISYSSNLDGDLGTSTPTKPLVLHKLSIGVHTITATATDLDGLTAKRTFTLTARDGAPTVVVQVRNSNGAYVTATTLDGIQGGTAYLRLVATTPIPLALVVCDGASWSGSLVVSHVSGCDFSVALSKVGTFGLTASLTLGGKTGTATVTAKIVAPPAVVPPAFSPITAVTNGSNAHIVDCGGGPVQAGETMTLLMYYNNYAQANSPVTYKWQVETDTAYGAGALKVLSGADSNPTRATQRNYTFSAVGQNSTYTFVATAYNGSGKIVGTATCRIQQDKPIG